MNYQFKPAENDQSDLAWQIWGNDHPVAGHILPYDQRKALYQPKGSRGTYVHVHCVSVAHVEGEFRLFEYGARCQKERVTIPRSQVFISVTNRPQDKRMNKIKDLQARIEAIQIRNLESA